ncbi:MAG: helix-turn-helix transcriptional regulator [Clostridia bacterium]|nr:helix-turn-helix transcriptional regulator [Clostridia bacterium]
MAGLMPHEEKSLKTKRSILDATEELLADGGLEAVTVRGVCERAGAAYGSFYHHFGSKERVVAACCERQFEACMQSNPCPSEIAEGDYIARCLWYGLVFGAFCEGLGRGVVRYLYLNGPGANGLFPELFTAGLFPAVGEGLAAGFVRTHFFGADDTEKVVGNIKKDLRITCVGVVLWWCCLPEDEREETLADTLEHHIFHQLIHTVSDAYHEAGFPRALLTQRGLDKKVRMSALGTTGRKEENQ